MWPTPGTRSCCSLLWLVPEVPIVLEDALPHLERVVDKKGHAVVVVAEGAGEELLGASAEKGVSQASQTHSTDARTARALVVHELEVPLQVARRSARVAAAVHVALERLCARGG